MYDADTARLIRETPPLEGLDRERLPEELTNAFATIAATRFRLRQAGELGDESVARVITEMQRLAYTNEILVAVSPSRADRASAAFVAGSAHQLCFNARLISGRAADRTYVHAEAISSDIAAMLLFLVAEATADSTEIAERLSIDEAPFPIRSLVEALRSLGKGDLTAITSAALPERGEVTGDTAAEAALTALFFKILVAVRSLAAELLRFDKAEPGRAAETFRTVMGLCSAARGDERHWLGREVGSFAGPHHLASLLLAVAANLWGSAVTNVEPPGGIDPAKWLRSMRRIARKRPYLWRNHRDAIAEGYLDTETSAAVSFPTGAGKSTLAELKIYATLLADRKVVFLAPTNALVGQTTVNLRRTFKGANIGQERFEEVGFLSDEDELPQIFVMTPESCLAQMSIEPTVFDGVGLLIFDECHLLHPEQELGRRALDAMLCLLSFATRVAGANFLLLSAMMKNADEIARWIEDLTGRRCLALSLPWKPTRQLRGSVVYPLVDVERMDGELRIAERNGKTKAPSSADQARLLSTPLGLFSLKQTWATRNVIDYTLLKLLREDVQLAANKWWRVTPNSGAVSSSLGAAAAGAGIKTLIFFQTIRNAVSAKNRVRDHLGQRRIALSDEERRWLQIATLELGGSDPLFLDVQGNELVSSSVVHHGLLLPEERQLSESLYQRREGASVMIATSTVAQGMNFPSELVIIAEDSRFDEAKDRREVLQAQDLLNAAGRAGRAGQNANGIVLVIPGKVIGINLADGKIGSHWSKLQEVFGQSDQCLEIDDPLTAVLDRVHAQLVDGGDLERYAIARLASVGLENAIMRSLSGFRARKRGDAAWVADRVSAALKFHEQVKPESEKDLTDHQVASTLGIALPVMERLSRDLEGAWEIETVGDWRRWFFVWIESNADLFDYVFRPETVNDLFGNNVEKLESSAQRCNFALPRIKTLTRRWMSGEPLRDMQLALGTPVAKLQNCTEARKFVLRFIPELAYLFGVPALLKQRQNAAATATGNPLNAGLSKLGNCVRYGFQMYEQAALSFLMRGDKLSRREIHERLRGLSPHLNARPPQETWDAAVERVRLALITGAAN